MLCEELIIYLTDEATGGLSDGDFGAMGKIYRSQLAAELGMAEDSPIDELVLEDARLKSIAGMGLQANAGFGEIAMQMIRDGVLNEIDFPAQGWKEFFRDLYRESLGRVLCKDPNASWQKIERAQIVALVRSQLGIADGAELPLNHMSIKIRQRRD